MPRYPGGQPEVTRPSGLEVSEGRETGRRDRFPAACARKWRMPARVESDELDCANPRVTLRNRAVPNSCGVQGHVRTTPAAGWGQF